MSPSRSLGSYPRPNVAVDLAVLTVAAPADSPTEREQLNVLVLRPSRGRSGVLPGRFIRERRTIEETVRETLVMKLALEAGDISPRLLHVFDDPRRDARGWTLSLAHAVTLPPDRLSGCPAEMVPVDLSGDLATGETLGYDHNEIVRQAVSAMRDRYETAPDPDGLIDGAFTLSELRRLHEAVLGEALRKDTFNRRMVEQLEPVCDETGGPAMRRGVGRPAQLFTRRPGRHQGDARWRLPREASR